MTSSKKVDLLLLWLIPVASLIATAFYWHEIKGVGSYFIAFSFLLPAIFGYGIVGLATGPWKLWAWKTPYSIKGTILPQIGVLWSGYLNLSLLIISDSLLAPMHGLDPIAILKVALFAGIINLSICTNFDMICLNAGLLEVYAVRSKYRKQGLVGILQSYVVATFGGTGLIFGALAKIGHYYLVEQGRIDLFWALLVGSATVFCLPFFIHLLRGARFIRAYRLKQEALSADYSV